jgi:hypothetical protein
MTVDELKTAMQQPLWAACKGKKPDDRYCQKRFEQVLLEKLAQDASLDAAYLPLLQTTLQEMWNGGSLTLGKYDGLADAIRRRAEVVYNYVDYDASRPEEERPPGDQKSFWGLPRSGGCLPG